MNKILNNYDLSENYDFIILKTGYTSRIPRYLNDFQKKINNVLESGCDYLWMTGDNHIVCIKDNLWGGSNNFILCDDQKDYDFVKSITDEDGIVLLKNVSIQQTLDLIEYFGTTVRFCSFCGIEHIYEMTIYEKDAKKVLLIIVDTESG